MKAQSRNETTRAIETAGIVAILRMVDTAQIDVVVDALVAGGICMFEVTMTTPDAIEVLAHLSDRLRDTPCIVGMGTVMDIRDGRANRARGGELRRGTRVHTRDPP